MSGSGQSNLGPAMGGWRKSNNPSEMQLNRQAPRRQGKTRHRFLIFFQTWRLGALAVQSALFLDHWPHAALVPTL
jgi:hypothetical protein